MSKIASAIFLAWNELIPYTYYSGLEWVSWSYACKQTPIEKLHAENVADIFYKIGPLGQFGLVVAKSVCLSPSHAIVPGEKRRS